MFTPWANQDCNGAMAEIVNPHPREFCQGEDALKTAQDDGLGLELPYSEPISRRQRPRLLFHAIQLRNQRQRRPHARLIRLQRLMEVSSGMSVIRSTR
jgi:hypothetical protein